jgi:hypothetical protein
MSKLRVEGIHLPMGAESLLPSVAQFQFVALGAGCIDSI